MPNVKAQIPNQILMSNDKKGESIMGMYLLWTWDFEI
jgi:hypothetical protein